MDKKGFTLIELLMVVVLISMISMIAIPNVMNIYDSTNKENMLNDAKRFISLAKERVNSNYEIRNSLNYNFLINDVIYDDMTDSEGKKYNASSFVKYFVDENTDTVNYCVTLLGSRYSIGKYNCVLEKKLDINSVEKNN